MRAMRAGAAVVVLAIAAGAVTAASGAVDPDKAGRVKFVKRADDICQKKGNDARRKVQRGVEYLSHHRLRKAGIEFAAAYRELRQGYRRIGRLHRPVHGHRHIAKWLRIERRATAVGVNAAVALQRRKLERAARLTRKSAHLERRAYEPVRSFKFKRCRPL